MMKTPDDSRQPNGAERSLSSVSIAFNSFKASLIGMRARSSKNLLGICASRYDSDNNVGSPRVTHTHTARSCMPLSEGCRVPRSALAPSVIRKHKANTAPSTADHEDLRIPNHIWASSSPIHSNHTAGDARPIELVGFISPAAADMVVCSATLT